MNVFGALDSPNGMTIHSIYSQYYSNSPSMPLALLSVSPRHSPAVSLSHTSPVVKQPRGDSTQQHGVNDSGYFKGSSSHSQNHLYDIDRGSLRSTDNKHRNVHRSGPLDYSSSRKVKLVVEGSTFGSTCRSPLPRFTVSRSRHLMYK
jgi:NCK-associated protein 1